MKIESVTRYSFIGDNAQQDAEKQRKKQKMFYGKLVGELIYYPMGRVGFEVTTIVY